MTLEQISLAKKLGAYSYSSLVAVKENMTNVFFKVLLNLLKQKNGLDSVICHFSSTIAIYGTWDISKLFLVIEEALYHMGTITVPIGKHADGLK